MKKHVRFSWMWDWTDIGIMFRVYKTTKSANYHFCIDIQVLWPNLWIQLGKRKK